MHKAPRPQNIKLKVLGHSWLSHKVVKVDFEVIEPVNFDFIPGQHVNLRIGDKIARPYSISTDLSTPGRFSIVVSAGHEGLGSTFLKNIKPGDIITGIGPLGRLYLHDNYTPNITFFAAGSGISLTYTMLHKLALDKVKSKVRFYWGLHSEEDVILAGDLDKLKGQMDFDYQIYFSGRDGYVTKVFDEGKIQPENTQFYVFGVSKMVTAVKLKLAEIGVKEESIIG